MDLSGPQLKAQTEYSLACLPIINLLHEMNEIELANRFQALAGAFADLTKGTVPPLFKPQNRSSKRGQKEDRGVVWRIRAQVCIGVKLIEEAGKERDAAIKYATKHRKAFKNVQRTGSTLETSIKNWLKSFQNTAVPDAVASFWYDAAVADLPATRMQMSGKEMIEAAKSLLKKAADEASETI